MRFTLLHVAIYSLLLQHLCAYSCTDEPSQPTWYDSIARCIAEYKKSVLCLLARCKAGSQPIKGAVYYIRHRKSGFCLTYHAGYTYTKNPACECPYHEHPEVIYLLENCSRVVTYHSDAKNIVEVSADWIAGNRPNTVGGPYAARISKPKQNDSDINLDL